MCGKNMRIPRGRKYVVSKKYLFILGVQTMQIYSSFEGIPLFQKCSGLGWGHIMIPGSRRWDTLVFQDKWIN